MGNLPEKNMLLLENRQIKDVSVSEEDIPVKWCLYWLKKTEYNSNIHSALKKFQFHSHSFYEIHFILKGTVEYQVAEKSIKVNAGEFLMLFPQVSHALVSKSNGLEKMSIGFDIFFDEKSETTNQLAVLRDFFYYHGVSNTCILSSLNMILDDVDEKDPNSKIIRRALLNVFILSLLKELPHYNNPNLPKKDEPSIPGLTDETVYTATLSYIQSNMNKNVSIQELSDALRISSSQINRRLIRYSGMSFSRIKDKVKCAKVRELLATNMTMAQISEAIGLSNEFSLNRFFKRVEGMPPGRFREALLSNNYR